MARTALIAALAALAILVSAQPAAATYPGRNGDLLLTFERGRGTLTISLGRLDPATGEIAETQLCSSWATSSPDYCRYTGGPAVSPDGTRAAVVTDDSRWGGEIGTSLRVVTLADGRQQRVPLTAEGYSDRPWVAWSPLPDQLLVSRVADLYRIDLEGHEGALVAPNAADPDWSADGRIAFVRSGDIHAGPPGGPFTRLTYKGASSPSWSPHARWIAFSRGQAVYVVPASGGKARRIVGTGVAKAWLGAQATVWSPDGRLIAYFRERHSELYAFTVSRRTGKSHRISGQLTSRDGAAAVYAPVWQSLPR
jgi:Tol biopolymer transport system component